MLVFAGLPDVRRCGRSYGWIGVLAFWALTATLSQADPPKGESKSLSPSCRSGTWRRRTG
jgi:hypothetical protein